MSDHTHINSKGQFQSDRHPTLKADKIVLSFRDKRALRALQIFAYDTEDRQLGKDVLERVRTIQLERRIEKVMSEKEK